MVYVPVPVSAEWRGKSFSLEVCLLLSLYRCAARLHAQALWPFAKHSLNHSYLLKKNKSSEPFSVSTF